MGRFKFWYTSQMLVSWAKIISVTKKIIDVLVDPVRENAVEVNCEKIKYMFIYHKPSA
jgi:hypothetical protein